MAKEIETLPPQNFIQLIEIRIKELKKALKLKQYSIKHSLEGSVRIVRNKGTLQFYLRESKSDLQGKYLPRSQKKLARTLIQKDYDQKAVSSLTKELEYLKKIAQNYNENSSAIAYENLPKTRQLIIEPLTLSDSQYAEKWLSIEYRHKGFDPQQAQLFTDNNERVRSKSEVLIANALKANGIPYRYEFPIVINRAAGSGAPASHDDEYFCSFYPDFYCLNLRTRHEFIWEHFGLMNDSAYASQTAEKIMLYQANGYFPGKNLIISMETTEHPLSSKDIKRMIDTYLK